MSLHVWLICSLILYARCAHGETVRARSPSNVTVQNLAQGLLPSNISIGLNESLTILGARLPRWVYQ